MPDDVEVTDWQAVSARIRERREALGMTQAALGALVGSSANYVAQVEGGLRLSETKLAKYAAALGMTLPYLRYAVASATDAEEIRRLAREEGRREALAEMHAWLGRSHADRGGIAERLGVSEEGSVAAAVSAAGSREATTRTSTTTEEAG